MTALAQIQRAPQTGLAGYENAVGRGLTGGISVLESQTQRGADALMNSARGGMREDEAFSREALASLNGGFDSAADGLTDFTNGGSQAQSVQAALSGAMGPQAQQQAMANFSSSPGQQYLVDQSERAITRNAAATGGLQGGNVLKELQRNGVGLAAQDFQANFDRLGSVADRGFTAANALGGLRATQGQMGAGVLSDVGSRALSTRVGTGQNVASLLSGAGQVGAGMVQRAGETIGGARLDTGNRIADSIASTTQQVASNQSGDVMADLLGGSSATLGNLIIQAQSGDANSKEQLAQLLANLAAQQGGSVSGLPGIPGIQETQGGLNRFMSALPG